MTDDGDPVVVLPLLGSLLLTIIIQTTFFFISYYFKIDRVLLSFTHPLLFR